MILLDRQKWRTCLFTASHHCFIERCCNSTGTNFSFPVWIGWIRQTKKNNNKKDKINNYIWRNHFNNSTNLCRITNCNKLPRKYWKRPRYMHYYTCILYIKNKQTRHHGWQICKCHHANPLPYYSTHAIMLSYTELRRWEDTLWKSKFVCRKRRRLYCIVIVSGLLSSSQNIP